MSRHPVQVSNQIKKHNAVRSKAQKREEKLVKLEQQTQDLVAESDYLASNKEGASAEAIRLRQLENDLDKAIIKGQEADHIGKTYAMIIEKLLKDRLNFDNEVTELETTLRDRRAELEELEALNTDAINARDAARRLDAEVAALEAQAAPLREALGVRA